MYCSRCDRDNVGGFHRCFNSVLTRNAIYPLKKRPDKKKRISFRLLERLRQEIDLYIAPDAVVERYYPGTHQRSSGAFLWGVKHDSIVSIGSCYTMKECLGAKELTIFQNHGDWEVVPTITQKGESL